MWSPKIARSTPLTNIPIISLLLIPPGPPDLMAQENVPTCCNPSTSNLFDFFDIIFLMFYAEACFRTVQCS